MDGCLARHECEDFFSSACSGNEPEIPGCFRDRSQATNPPVPQVCSKDLLRRTAVLEAIDSEPEYPDADGFTFNVKATIQEEYEVSDELAAAVADCLIMCARTAVRQTKEEISKKILAL